MDFKAGQLVELRNGSYAIVQEVNHNAEVLITHGRFVYNLNGTSKFNNHKNSNFDIVKIVSLRNGELVNVDGEPYIGSNGDAIRLEDF